MSTGDMNQGSRDPNFKGRDQNFRTWSWAVGAIVVLGLLIWGFSQTMAYRSVDQRTSEPAAAVRDGEASRAAESGTDTMGATPTPSVTPTSNILPPTDSTVPEEAAPPVR